MIVILSGEECDDDTCGQAQLHFVQYRIKCCLEKGSSLVSTISMPFGTVNFNTMTNRDTRRQLLLQYLWYAVHAYHHCNNYIIIIMYTLYCMCVV